MKTFKLSQSKDDNLLKITSKKTNYEIKLTDNELLELRTKLGFNEVKIEPKEVENEKSIDWEKLSFPEWFYQTSKIEFNCYEDLRAHYMSDETSIDNVHKMRLFTEKVNPTIELTNTERLYKILTNPKILKVGEVVKIGEYECIVKQNEVSYNYYFKFKVNGNIKVFSQFGLSNEDVRDKFNSEKTRIFPETYTLKELTKIYYYLKTFEV